MMRILSLILLYFIWQTAFAGDLAPKVPTTSSQKADTISKSIAPSQKSYFQSLFDEVEVAKTTPPDISSKQLYDKLSKDSVAYGVLKEYPNLQMGDLEFRPMSSTATHRPQILQGQEMIRKTFLTDKPLTYRAVTDTINTKMTDPTSSMNDMDWVLMSNAFRTMKAPGKSHEAHLLGDLLAEYILLAEIRKQESKPNLTNDDRSFLSTLYYDLSQLYKSMYKNEQQNFKVTNKGQLKLPIAPIYRGSEFQEPYDQGYDVITGALVGRHLDLLGNSLLFDPYDDLGWAQLIDFAVFDLVDPWYYDEYYPEFWNSYFPYGITVIEVDRIRQKWQGIHKNTRHYKHLRQNGPGMNRALRKFSRAAGPKSRFNRAIHNARPPSTFVSPRGRNVRGESIAQGRGVSQPQLIAPRSKDYANRAPSARAERILKSQRKSSTKVAKPAPSQPQQLPRVYKGREQHNDRSRYGHTPSPHGGDGKIRHTPVGDTSFKQGGGGRSAGSPHASHTGGNTIKQAGKSSQPQSPDSDRGDKRGGKKKRS